MSFALGATPGMGMGGQVKEVAGEAPLDAVDSIEVKRLLMGKVVNVVYSVISNAVAIAQAPTRDAVMVVKALADKKSKEGAAAA